MLCLDMPKWIIIIISGPRLGGGHKCTTATVPETRRSSYGTCLTPMRAPPIGQSKTDVMTSQN